MAVLSLNLEIPLILNELDCTVTRVREEIRLNKSVGLFIGDWSIKICEVGLELCLFYKNCHLRPGS